MKRNTYRFEMEVSPSLESDTLTREDAATRVLSCFARRKPDGCSFRLLESRPRRRQGKARKSR